MVVPRVYSFGKGWIHREYFPGGMKLEAALEKSEEAREAYREIYEFLKKKRAFYGEDDDDSASSGLESSSQVSSGVEGVHPPVREGLSVTRTLGESGTSVSEFSAHSVSQIDPSDGNSLGEAEGVEAISYGLDLSSSSGLRGLDGRGITAESGLRLRTLSISDGRKDKRGGVREDTPVPPMVNEEGTFEFFSSHLSPEQREVFEEGMRSLEGDLRGPSAASQGSEEERDFVMGLSQRVDGKTNNLLWMPQIRQFVWIDIF